MRRTLRCWEQLLAIHNTRVKPRPNFSPKRGEGINTIEVVKRSSKAFEVLPRRWVVERTFAWLVQNRRLVIDSEKLPEISEALIEMAMTRLMLKRLAISSA
ncbi:transposase [Euhalothece natronophila Z-M001]|uniref:Transposase n=1 Tax=Euhalothece natronophila Z-M001 TaxID=522448 RepID=A0A5B8NJD5_9CHRO|nr:transposase [Euhalothece natronophila Z-M001]